jgi:transposase
MEKLPSQVYTKEFQENAVKLVLEEGLCINGAAKRLSMPMQTLSTWVKSRGMGNTGGTNMKTRTVSEIEAENSRLRRENAELKMARDILKKATV